jgi:uncharacterized protein
VTKPRPLSTPLSDDEYELLADFLDGSSPYDTDGLLGLLHAVSIAPSLMPPSSWLHILLPDGMGAHDVKGAQEFVGLLIRLYNEVLRGLSEKRLLMPEPDDVDGCNSFAAGFLAGAEADPEWIDDDAHWTFAAWAAYLSGKPDLITPSLLKKLDDDPDVKRTLYETMGAIVLSAHDVFLRARRTELGQTPSAASAPTTTRVGRNEPCPCGSGKKYKRCCIDGGASVTH